ncbi:hypothetical protein RISK_002663 [Rhodopirellula islandica]|uniref:Uncharacterized protein n=1 Tax=Rhodopirellula islandica TaxID=595434 RepID=A0A0J1BFH4_RHOIS|nr:hypothetical protein RISK_002663 [Rhodopirellula islandica]
MRSQVHIAELGHGEATRGWCAAEITQSCGSMPPSRSGVM